MRTQLVQFAVIVLEQHELPMKMMNFYGIIDDQEMTVDDERLVEAICSSNEKQLEMLGLGGNYLWWEN